MATSGRSLKNTTNLENTSCQFIIFVASYQSPIIFSSNRFVVCSVKCEKSGKNVDLCFTKAKIEDSKTSKKISFTLIENEEFDFIS